LLVETKKGCLNFLTGLNHTRIEPVEMSAPQPIPTADVQNLATIVTEWRRIHEEISKAKQEVSEKNKRAKVLEGIIMGIMKQQNLGALDLKSSGGRILYEKKERKAGLNTKKLQKFLTDHLKDESKAAEAVKYVTENLETVNKEKLAYEKL
jgi:Family of unknown function (DUF5760)